ncbi:MAG: proline dehydrogenase family protein, partial [Acidobacteria bacterium]|nr:proline dehydrogenase family protein [Acidobacteriota bacterium]MCA1640231.1 proline dehydrogenase family protein [Acidobacteriota bacterium]
IKLTKLAFRLRLPVKGLIKKTIFRQFCGGETIEECNPTVEKLGASNIGTILDYSVEGKSEDSVFESTKNEIYRTITRAKEDPNIPFAVFKVTGLASYEILEKVSGDKELLKTEAAEWETVKNRVLELGEYAYSLEQPVFVDAEESWVQDTIDALVTEMMEKFNQEKPIIFNTIQLYRHDRLDFLKKSREKAKAGGYILAVKLVRGAYMEKERERAAEMGYPSPIQPSKEATDRDFDAALNYCLENIEEIAFVAGTHNEESVCMLAEKLHEKGISHNHPHVYFSQLYGMSDNLSYILADKDYNVSKYVPYGPIRDAIPYLIRRAKENTAVIGQMSRELELIDKELKRRNI